jgi:hypothetical protein
VVEEGEVAGGMWGLYDELTWQEALENLYEVGRLQESNGCGGRRNREEARKGLGAGGGAW